MKRFACFLLICAILTLAGCGGRQADMPETPAEQTEEPAPEERQFLPETKEPETSEAPETAGGEQSEEELSAQKAAQEAAYVQQILAGMTLEEKVGQMFFVRCPRSDVPAMIAQYHLGGVLLFTRDYQDAAENWLTKEAFTEKIGAYQAAAKADTGIALFIGSDEEGGSVTRASRNPNLFPEKSKSPRELFASGGLGAILTDAAQKNQLLRTYGINVNFAPVCDVSTDPNDFMYERSFGENAAETMAYVVGVVSVMRDQGVGAVLKHFPGYGNNVDTHTGVAIDTRPVEWFREADFLPFQGGIRAGAPFVLVSHNVVVCMDADYPASLSVPVHALLRDELGFDGVILTDDLAMDAVGAYAADGSAAVLAVRAGNDMLVTTDFETQYDQVLTAVKYGTLDESLIDAACTRILLAKYRLGLL